MEEEKILRDAVLIYLVTKTSVVLPIKVRHIGAGKRNGYGGGIEPGENALTAAIRETEQETTPDPEKDGVFIQRKYTEKFGEIEFHNITEKGERFICKVHIFLCSKWRGKIRDSDEMIKAKSFKKNALPLKQMMAADRYFLPMILEGNKITGTAKYGPHQRRLLEPMQISIVGSFSDGGEGRVEC